MVSAEGRYMRRTSAFRGNCFHKSGRSISSRREIGPVCRLPSGRISEKIRTVFHEMCRRSDVPTRCALHSVAIAGCDVVHARSDIASWRLRNAVRRMTCMTPAADSSERRTGRQDVHSKNQASLVSGNHLWIGMGDAYPEKGHQDEGFSSKTTKPANRTGPYPRVPLRCAIADYTCRSVRTGRGIRF